MKSASAVTARCVQGGLLGLLSLLLCLVLLGSGNAQAANPLGGGGVGLFIPGPLLPAPPVPPQFDITGFIQEASLDRDGAVCKASDPRLAGGSVKVNGITVIVPCNTILQMPAATLTWQELFSLAPRDIGLPIGSDGIATQTGLALNDTVKRPAASVYNGPLPSYEIHVQGNVVKGQYIAGLIFISQQSLNLIQGVITAIDYANGELQIATVMAEPGQEAQAVRDIQALCDWPITAASTLRRIDPPSAAELAAVRAFDPARVLLS